MRDGSQWWEEGGSVATGTVVAGVLRGVNSGMTSSCGAWWCCCLRSRAAETSAEVYADGAEAIGS